MKIYFVTKVFPWRKIFVMKIYFVTKIFPWRKIFVMNFFCPPRRFGDITHFNRFHSSRYGLNLNFYILNFSLPQKLWISDLLQKGNKNISSKKNFCYENIFCNKNFSLKKNFLLWKIFHDKKFPFNKKLQTIFFVMPYTFIWKNNFWKFLVFQLFLLHNNHVSCI